MKSCVFLDPYWENQMGHKGCVEHLTEPQCKALADADADNGWAPGDWADLVPGHCSVMYGELFYWNTDPIGTTNLDSRQICVKQSNFF